MSDWGSAAIIDAFPRAGKCYFIQFINEPELRDRVDQVSGRKYTQLEVNLQFFALTEFGTYEYIGWGNKSAQPCVFEDLLLYRSELLENMYKVEGFEHKRHVDLECKKRLPRQQASETLTRDAQPQPQPETHAGQQLSMRRYPHGMDAQTGPPKPASGKSSPSSPDEDHGSGRGQPVVGGMPISNDMSAAEMPAGPPATCSHANIRLVVATEGIPEGFYCKDCGERVG